MSNLELEYPAGAEFAFTILDDTDDSTVENTKPVYDLLHELGFRTTKTVWPLDCPEGSRIFFAAQTLQDPEYLAFVHELVDRGFELACHGATMESSERERTLRGLAFLEREFGHVPALYCNHGQNLENVYWGAARYRTLAIRLPLALLERALGRPTYSGHRPASPFFWGDVCRERFRFVRSFAFAELNTLRIPPHAPYRLRDTPFVQYWFNTSDASGAQAFKRLVNRASVDRLRRERGVCILSTHLGKGFARGGRVDEEIESTLRYIAGLPGWFGTVSEVLEHLRGQRQPAHLRPWERWRLELRHLQDRVRVHYLAKREQV